MSERRWPVVFVFRLRRCQADFYEDDPRRCGRLIWPWQALVREWDPECGGALVHHDCHHRSTENLYRRDYGDNWSSWLHCEHVTENTERVSR